MYYPYLRGKQNELLAIREMANPINGLDQLIRETVTPIIEPVRENMSSLTRYFNDTRANGISSVLILNPQVGELKTDSGFNSVCNFAKDLLPARTELGLILNDPQQFISDLTLVKSAFGNLSKLFVIQEPENLSSQTLQTISAALGHIQDVIFVSRNRSAPRTLQAIGATEGIMLADFFADHEQQRNADYVSLPEAEFSEDYFWFKKDGWAGIADFQTIGASWSAGGFSPRVVALHWTYQYSVQKRVMISHFTSTSNLDTSDPAGKFSEAAAALLSFVETNHLPDSLGFRSVRTHVENGTYPGLGPVKKFSIQNHIEVVARIVSSI